MCKKCLSMFLSEAHWTFALIMLLILCSGDIKTSPGPKKNTKGSFCHWNLNRIAAHNLSKVSLLQAMATTHDYGICLSETLLDDRINIERYNLLRAAHRNDNERGRVCILKSTIHF